MTSTSVTQVMDTENQLPVMAKGLGHPQGKPALQHQQRNALGMIRDENVQRNLKETVGDKNLKKIALQTEANKRPQDTVFQDTTHCQKKRDPTKNVAEMPTTKGFSILCDESFSADEEDLFSDESLEINNQTLQLTSTEEKDKARSTHGLNDSTTELFAGVTVNSEDRVLKDLDMSIPVLTDEEDDLKFVTPAMDSSMSRAGSVMMLDSQEEEDVDAMYTSLEYKKEILDYLLKMEKSFLPDAMYMTTQADINFKMRSILIDWMVEVTEEYKLHDETLFLAVSFIDRFLSQMSITRQTFQLLGSASLFIASKYEEIYPPDVNEFVAITDDSYTKEQVLNMEMCVLKTLNMNISSPTSLYFIKTFLSCVKFSSQVVSLSQYLCFISMLEGESYLMFTPSEVAMSCLLLSSRAFSEEESLLADPFFHETLSTMIKTSNYDHDLVAQDKMNECMRRLSHSYSKADKHAQQAIFTRFSTHKFYSVASIGIIKPLETQ